MWPRSTNPRLMVTFSDSGTLLRGEASNTILFIKTPYAIQVDGVWKISSTLHQKKQIKKSPKALQWGSVERRKREGEESAEKCKGRKAVKAVSLACWHAKNQQPAFRHQLQRFASTSIPLEGQPTRSAKKSSKPFRDSLRRRIAKYINSRHRP